MKIISDFFKQHNLWLIRNIEGCTYVMEVNQNFHLLQVFKIRVLNAFRPVLFNKILKVFYGINHLLWDYIRFLASLMETAISELVIYKISTEVTKSVYLDRHWCF